MPVCLVPVDEGQRITLGKAVVFLGRHPDCDVILSQSRKISRKHCCIAQVDQRFVIRDLGSMNGVRVNGRRVKLEAAINFGDTIAIGDRHFVLKRVDQAAPVEKAETPDLGAPAGANSPSADNVNLSQDFPVPIEEQPEVFSSDTPNKEAAVETPIDEPVIDFDNDEGDVDFLGVDDLYPLDENSGEYELLPD